MCMFKPKQVSSSTEINISVQVFNINMCLSNLMKWAQVSVHHEGDKIACMCKVMHLNKLLHTSNLNKLIMLG